MNPPIRFILISLLSFLLILERMHADCASHPTDPSAYFLGSFILAFPVDSGGNGFLNQNCAGYIEVCVWLVGGSRVDYVLNVGTMTFSGDCDVIDGMTLPEIMDQAATAAVARGTELDYTGCGDTTDVWVGQCAERSGSGEGTTFDPCDTQWCRRRYLIVCGPSGTVYQQLLEDPAACTGSSTGCEPACTIVD